MIQQMYTAARSCDGAQRRPEVRGSAATAAGEWPFGGPPLGAGGLEGPLSGGRSCEESTACTCDEESLHLLETRARQSGERRLGRLQMEDVQYSIQQQGLDMHGPI